MKKFILTILCLTSVSTLANPAGPTLPTDVSVTTRVIVQYAPGPNFQNIIRVFPEHLSTFVFPGLKAGYMEHGGAFTNFEDLKKFSDKAPPAGGLFIYKVNQPDLSALSWVEEKVKTDPFIRDQIFTYTLSLWQMATEISDPEQKGAANEK